MPFASDAGPARGRRLEIDRAALRIAGDQHGIVSRTQLIEAGATARRIQLRVKSGWLRPVHRGVYLVGSVPPPKARHFAACLACGPGAVVSHGSAARLWGLTSAEPDSDEIDVTLTGASRRHRGVRIHRSTTLLTAERTRIEGIPVTTPDRTLLDLAVLQPGRELERAVAEAFARGLTTEGRLARVLARHVGRPGSARLRSVLDLGPPPLTRSEAEERFLDLIRRARMPRPSVNDRIGPYEVDFHWPGAGLVVEVDGFATHHSRRAFERDRRRDRYLVGEGFRVMRVTWRQLEDEPEGLLFRLGQALAPRRPWSASREGGSAGT
jgi:very-short-patch-repair endonuclease